ncbi:UDP-N-acetylglucosamine 2-epimerase (non-hydrolyzing) [Acidimicrobiaceae bacterium]|nr:UDP-N-acetylglucosamine 2-epimerase (non-hydrolyzing) [Acidimicrobiaceae bacterium]
MKDLAIILGIRPDVIRASKIIKLLSENNNITFDFIWSGQHYSENMKDVFFKQLNVPEPDVEFEINTTSDASTVSSVIKNTFNHLENNSYKAVVFLGDTNTVIGSIGAAQQNVPIVHIEGCMRSYDWRMPEEKYRKTIDHLSDRIYAYLDSYRLQGLNEGISEDIIKVTGNPIVDIIEEYQSIFDSGYETLDSKVLDFTGEGEFLLATSHRRENILNLDSLNNIVNLFNSSDMKTVFPAGYKTQEMLKSYDLKLNSNVLMTDPLGYLEFMYLLKRSTFVMSDSGTVVEEACIMNVPSIQMRYSTERPEVYDVGASIKFDPSSKISDFQGYIDKVVKLVDTKWEQPFGDGKASNNIVDDLVELSRSNSFHKHNKENYSFDISNSFKE